MLNVYSANARSIDYELHTEIFGGIVYKGEFGLRVRIKGVFVAYCCLSNIGSKLPSSSVAVFVNIRFVGPRLFVSLLSSVSFVSNIPKNVTDVNHSNHAPSANCVHFIPELPFL
jgi:hypothetical protein